MSDERVTVGGVEHWRYSVGHVHSLEREVESLRADRDERAVQKGEMLAEIDRLLEILRAVAANGVQVETPEGPAILIPQERVDGGCRESEGAMTLPETCPWCGAAQQFLVTRTRVCYACGSHVLSERGDDTHQSKRCLQRAAFALNAKLLEERDEFRKQWLAEQAARIEQAKFLDTYSAAKAELQIQQLTRERDEAREAARWMLPFVLSPSNAVKRWPWLEQSNVQTPNTES